MTQPVSFWLPPTWQSESKGSAWNWRHHWVQFLMKCSAQSADYLGFFPEDHYQVQSEGRIWKQWNKILLLQTRKVAVDWRLWFAPNFEKQTDHICIFLRSSVHIGADGSNQLHSNTCGLQQRYLTCGFRIKNIPGIFSFYSDVLFFILNEMLWQKKLWINGLIQQVKSCYS